LIVIPRWAGNASSWRLSVHLGDRLSNTTTVTSAQLARRHQASALTARSRSDRTKPNVSDIRITPRTIDVRNADGVVRVSARVTDTGSGIAAGGVITGLGDRVHPRHVSGTRYAGRYVGEVMVPRCAGLLQFSGPETVSMHVHAGDRAGHDRGSGSQPRPPVSAQFRDNDWPGYGAALRPSGQVDVLFFDEDVVTNGSWNPRVAARGSAVEVVGTWSCTNASGGTVSCDADPFRTAHFTPALPLAPGPTYEVAVSREHTLHVVDLAGNPVLDTEVIVPAAG
jgi:hypothetical protein